MQISTLTCLLLAGSAAFAQTKFDVASIKPNAANDDRIMIRMMPGGRFVATGITVKELIAQAYNVRPFQVQGGPGWMDSERFDINAKGEGLPDRVPPDVLRPMLQALLQDRFGLKTREESKEMPGFALVVGKNGTKLKPVEGEAQRQMRMGRGQINAKGMPMAMLAQQLGQMLGRTVVDKTELKGGYDIELNFTPEPGAGHGGPDALAATDNSGPTIYTALQEQLGLKLESQKTATKMLIIEKVDKPSEN